MIKVSLLLFFALVFHQANSQSLNSFSKNVFEIIRQRDTANVFTIFFNPEKDKSILAGSSPSSLVMETNNAGLNEFQKRAKNEFVKMIEKGTNLGIDWSIADMEGYEFSVLYNDQLKLPMGKGTIKVKSNRNTYFIEIKSMVELEENGWKILAIDIIK
ncbi:MAG: hypothetical protein SFU21_11090 [Flavihumibacter sp.]|nr:hypothetical protein [Flavihumibacter sp.]